MSAAESRAAGGYGYGRTHGSAPTGTRKFPSCGGVPEGGGGYPLNAMSRHIPSHRAIVGADPRVRPYRTGGLPSAPTGIRFPRPVIPAKAGIQGIAYGIRADTWRADTWVRPVIGDAAPGVPSEEKPPRPVGHPSTGGEFSDPVGADPRVRPYRTGGLPSAPTGIRFPRPVIPVKAGIRDYYFRRIVWRNTAKGIRRAIRMP